MQVSFFKAYRGISFDGPSRSGFLSQFGVDEVLKVPLTLEHQDLELPYNVQVCLDKCLKLTLGFGPAEPHEEFDRLVHLGTMYKSYFSGLTKIPSDGRSVQKNLTDLQALLERWLAKPTINQRFEPPQRKVVTQQPPQEEVTRKVQ